MDEPQRVRSGQQIHANMKYNSPDMQLIKLGIYKLPIDNCADNLYFA